MDIRHVQAGEPLESSAKTHNAFVDAANAYRRTQRNALPGGSLPPLLPGQVYCKNTTGVTRKRYDVLAIDSLSTATLAKADRLTSAANLRYTPVVIGITPVPATEAHNVRVAILDAPALDDAIVPAWVSGTAVARVEYTDGNGLAAVITTGHALENAKSGPFRIIALGDTSDEQLALVDLSCWGTYRQVITDLRTTASGIDYKTQEVRVIGEQDESAWTALIEFEACTSE